MSCSDHDEMEGVAGSVAPADGSFRGAGKEPAHFGYLPVEYAPLRRKVKRAVRFPQLHRPLFLVKKRPRKVVLHEPSDRAMVIESFLT